MLHAIDTSLQYNGKDDRSYRGEPIDWADLAAAMKAENGACPYGAGMDKCSCCWFLITQFVLDFKLAA